MATKNIRFLGLILFGVALISCNNDPKANAGADTSIAVGSTVALDGGKSENAKSYAWSIKSMPDTSTAALSSTTEQKTTLKVDVVGHYDVTLVIKNDEGESTDEIVITAMPTVALPKTDAVSCVLGDDDGKLAMGIDAPSPRFTNPDGTTPISGGTILDRLTGLTWVRDTNLLPECGTGYLPWPELFKYINCINSKNYLGYSDWRLSNVNELKSLYYYRQKDAVKWLGEQGFSNTQASYMSSDSFWRFRVERGLTDPIIAGSSTGAGSPWPVRGDGQGAPGRLARTGKTTCRDDNGNDIACAGTGQDGDIMAGLAWPEPRFVKSRDGASITDNLTGLVWVVDSNLMHTKNPGLYQDIDPKYDGAVTRQHAFDYVAKLNQENYLDHSDWRLPNIVELQSLLAHQDNPGPTWLKNQGFLVNLDAESSFWSSTCSASEGISSWTIKLDGSDIREMGQIHLYVWPVRSAL